METPDTDVIDTIIPGVDITPDEIKPDEVIPDKPTETVVTEEVPPVVEAAPVDVDEEKKQRARNAVKASTLRKRIKDGYAPTNEESIFLAEYEANKLKPGRKKGGGSSSTGAAPTSEGGPPPVRFEVIKGGKNDTKDNSDTDLKLDGMGDMLVDLVSAVNEENGKAGLLTVPDPFLNFMRKCAVRMERRIATSLSKDVDQETLDTIVIAAPTAFVFYQARKRTKMPQKEVITAPIDPMTNNPVDGSKKVDIKVTESKPNGQASGYGDYA